MKRLLAIGFMLAVLGLVTSVSPALAQEKPAPVTPEVAVAMLKAAKLGASDIVIVLGSGDGTIAIAAAKDFGASKVVGVESDAALVKQAMANAEKAGVAGKVTFMNQDPGTASTSGATVVVLNLPASVNQKLSAKLKLGLEPDSRVVSHGANMGDDWWPDQTIAAGSSKIFVWVVPYR
jgi:predicted RNA methylase